jgi:hypothetical protein
MPFDNEQRPWFFPFFRSAARDPMMTSVRGGFVSSA